MKASCRMCKGDGFAKPFRRDQWGFGVPCPRCEGTGVESQRVTSDGADAPTQRDIGPD